MPVQRDVPLSWKRSDIEQRLCFRGGRFTSVNNWLAGVLGALLTIGFYALLLVEPIHQSAFSVSFLDRGICPYFTVLFSFWSLAILFIKWRKLRLQRRALQYAVVPPQHDFVLSATNVDVVTSNIYSTVDDPKHFVLFNRIMVALANLRNLGRVSDLDEILNSQAEQDESVLHTSYAILGAFIWAIPVLGFIGTVLGLSDAIGQFSGVLGGASDISQLTGALRGVTAGLATAFETTLQALVAALFIQLILTALRKSEEEFLDACGEYCMRNIVGKLRILPTQS
jgi:biopolymer transport protein ExbB/TolQ